jgi:hypothetical protein
MGLQMALQVNRDSLLCLSNAHAVPILLKMEPDKNSGLARAVFTNGNLGGSGNLSFYTMERKKVGYYDLQNSQLPWSLAKGAFPYTKNM